jgi:hypothetical protein
LAAWALLTMVLTNTMVDRRSSLDVFMAFYQCRCVPERYKVAAIKATPSHWRGEDRVQDKFLRQWRNANKSGFKFIRNECSHVLTKVIGRSPDAASSMYSFSFGL